MAIQTTRVTVDGFEAVVLANPLIEVTVLPELGAKIISLKNRRTGREWMWRSDKRPQLFRVDPGTGFDAGPFLGADECIPTIAACCWQDCTLPDHGEAWASSWQLDEAAFLQGSLVTRIELGVVPLVLQRRICLCGDTILLDYELTNSGGEALDYLWAFHPMMTIAPGDRLYLPETCRELDVELTMGEGGLDASQTVQAWPRPCAGIDFQALDLGPGPSAIKAFTQPEAGITEAGIHNAQTGDQLMFRLKTDGLIGFGLWINRQGFGGYDHVAIEPTNSATDSLVTAVEQPQNHTSIPAGCSKTWGFEIQVTAALKCD